MTGQGTATLAVDGSSASISVEVLAVNHRWLEVRVRVPPELADHALAVEDTVRKQLVRGRIDVGVRLEAPESALPRLDVERARAAFRELTALRDALAPAEAVPLSLLGAVPHLFSVRETMGHAAARENLIRATELACLAATEMRIREGASLAADFLERRAQLDQIVEAIKARGPQVIEATRARFVERVERLLTDGRSADPLRIEQEMALFADRSDVCEECTRLSSHLAQLGELIAGGDAGATGGSMGRRLEFLLQELARESNTLGQKSGDLAIARAVIDLKVEIERMREQAQNVL